MTWLQLELVAKALVMSAMVGEEPDELLRRSGLSKGQRDIALKLIEDEQFFVLLELKRAEQHALRAYERLTPQTEYLKDELESHLLQLQVLLGKMEVEEALRRDRVALLSTLPPSEQGEHHGLLAELHTELRALGGGTDPRGDCGITPAETNQSGAPQKRGGGTE